MIVNKLTPEIAFTEGTNIRTLANKNPQLARVELTRALKDLIEFVDANKTISTSDAFIATVEALITDFPAMTLEEYYFVFNGIKKGKYGKLYERLKLAEISDCIKKYEGEERARYLEERNDRLKGSGKKLDKVDYEAYAKRVAKEKSNKSNRIKETDFQNFNMNYHKNKCDHKNAQLIEGGKWKCNDCKRVLK